MKKSISKAKLMLNRETLKMLSNNELRLVDGAGPVTTKQLPCPIGTAKTDCESFGNC